MPPAEEEIRRRLAEFAAHWGGYHGSERAEAQTFLNELLACYGVDRQAAGVRFEERTEGGFMDLFWPGVCIVEMKRPSEVARLPTHRAQALQYWQRSGTPRSPAPRYVVLCAFHRFEIWEPGALYTEPRAVLDLVDLPDNLDVLNFFAGRNPVFETGGADLTREAVALVTDLYQQLRERRAADLDVLRDFVLQCVWAMFAEDLHMIPSHLFTRVVQSLRDDTTRSSADDLGQLFEYLATPGDRPQHGLYEGTPYANGSLFTKPARVHLEPKELDLLARAAGEFNWRQVEPAIFGGLLQGALGRERQWALGAHYTAEADILKIVLPTVVDPWRERIAACRTLDDVTAAQNDLMNYIVLDPACGSGNFLYVAYRELRRIEAELRRRGTDMRRNAGLAAQQTLSVYFPLSNMKGIELDPFAVQLARVTLWMGHKLAVDELDLDETVLPLADLSGIRRGDALRLDWPRADAIIGNPPYHGSQLLRRELGDEYVAWLAATFGIGVKDYAVYWFRKAHEGLKPGGRAGLVATNSISQNRNREPSLQWICETGGVIVNAVSTQDWSGEAAVDVSIVNWVREPTAPIGKVILDGLAVSQITASLREPGSDVAGAVTLPANRGRSFQGPQPVGAGFVLDPSEAEQLLERAAFYRDVVRPYLVGDDIATDPHQAPSRFIIDFGLRTLEQAMAYPDALDIVRERVKPFRDENRRRVRREKWWLLGELVPAMRTALSELPRYVAGVAQGKRIFFAWQTTWTCPSNLTNVFAFTDDSSMGVLSSTIHHEWARAQSSTLEDRFRYTPTSAFETYPWPQPDVARRDIIASAARATVARRSEICLERQIGLTTLYNEVDDGAYRDLRDLHAGLDEAVAAAYGWPVSVAHDPAESNRLLLELNWAIAAGEVAYHPFD